MKKQKLNPKVDPLTPPEKEIRHFSEEVRKQTI